MNKSSLPTAQKEAIGMLLDDHREFQKLVKEFEHAKTPEDKENIARRACTALKAHTRLEEELFYPAVRELDAEAFGELLNEALVEHASAKHLIEQLETMSPDEDLFEAKFTVLGEYVNHHVKEEEDELFPAIVENKADLRDLAQRMQARKEELTSKGKA